MTGQPCPQEQGHFDGASFLTGGVVGIVGGVFLALVIFVWAGPGEKTGAEILWRTDTGATCHIDKLYPATSCKALLADLGPRLSVVKVSR